MLFAGFSSIDITPDKAYPMAGYDLRSEANVGVHDRLFAKASVIANDTVVVAFCTLDLLGVPRDLASEVARRVSARVPIHESAVRVGAIHTHAAPKAIFTDAACYDPEYRRRVTEAAIDAIVAAYLNRGEVSAYYVHAAVGSVASYRDRVREDSSCEMPLDTVWLRSKEGKNDIIISVFACHPTVLNEANLLVTRDLVFGCETRLKERLSSTDFLFINGACADLSTRYTRRASDFSEVARLGALWADAAVDSLDSAEELSGEITYEKRRLFIPSANFFTDEQRRDTLVYLEEKINSCLDTEQRREYVSCRSVLKRENYGAKGGREVEIGVLRIGRLVFCSLPFEYAQADAARLKSVLDLKFGVNSIICCYTDGYEGYLPSGRPLDRDSGYEDVASPFRHDSKKLVAEALEALVRLVK